MFPNNLRTDLPEFNEHGVLPAGDYAPNQASFEMRFVTTEVPSSRTEIYTGWTRHRHTLMRKGLSPSARQLLNGSFTTEKDVPGDLDLVVEVPVSGDISTGLPPELAFVKDLLLGPAMKPIYRCDAYPLYSLPPAHELYADVTGRAIQYWLKWFGHTHEGYPKGRVWTTVGAWG